jgi:hypothetical protein
MALWTGAATIHGGLEDEMRPEFIGVRARRRCSGPELTAATPKLRGVSAFLTEVFGGQGDDGGRPAMKRRKQQRSNMVLDD